MAYTWPVFFDLTKHTFPTAPVARVLMVSKSLVLMRVVSNLEATDWSKTLEK
jgi:hypothetical protein